MKVAASIAIPNHLRERTAEDWTKLLLDVPNEVLPKVACIVWFDMVDLNNDFQTNDFFRANLSLGEYCRESDRRVRFWLKRVGYTQDLIESKFRREG